MKLFPYDKPNLDGTTCQLLNKIGVKFNPDTIKKELHSHPDYPSILALHDCLNELSIPNKTVRIEKADYQNRDLLYPFVAHFEENHGRFVLVNGITNGILSVSDEKGNSEITEAYFLDQWSGVLLFAAPNENSGEENYLSNRIRFLFADAVIPVNIMLVLGTVLYSVSSLPYLHNFLALSVIKMVGLFLCILLLIQSINSSNPLIKQICGITKSDCNAVLSSNAALVTKWLSWSEVGFFYFAGTLLLFLLVPNSIFILGWINMLALPYSFYSILYQYKTKKWCVLCCGVQILLWAEFISMAGGISLWTVPASFSAFSVGAVLICFLIPISLWSFLKPFFSDASQLDSAQRQLKKIKYNESLFNGVLKNQEQYSIGDDEVKPIAIGSASPKKIITMVSNPFCWPCAQAHGKLKKILEQREDVRLNVIYTTSDSEDDKRTKIASHMIALHDCSNMFEEALDDWNRNVNKNIEEWKDRYPVVPNATASLMAKKHGEWCSRMGIKVTPTFFIDGYPLPDLYSVEDLKYLI